MSEKRGTFLVTHAEEDSAVVRDVNAGQVHTLSSNPGVEANDAIDATVRPDPPMEVTWSVVDVEERRPLSIARSTEPPTALATELAADQDVGELTRKERAGIGEFHVISVPPEETDRAAEEVLADDATLVQAARLGVNRVEVRAADGVVSVRYLP